MDFRLRGPTVNRGGQFDSLLNPERIHELLGIKSTVFLQVWGASAKIGLWNTPAKNVTHSRLSSF
jgi:hypothetical protein